MSFDPRDFCSIAEQVAQFGTESAFRTAVGRSYYAAFLVAREKTGIRTRKGRKSVHQRIIEDIRNRKGYKPIGDQLSTLYWLRIVADYHLVPKSTYANWPNNWSRAQQIMTHILPKLQSLK